MLGHRTLTTQDYISILKKRWWIIALPVVVLTAVGYGITFFVPPQYLSQTLVLIEQQKVPDEYVKPIITEDLDARLASMKEQILSRSRLQPIVDHYNLYGSNKMSMDSRIDLVRKDIDIKPIHSQITGAGGLPGFFILFKAGDPHTAQQVCGEIESLFVNEDLRSRTQSAEGTTEFLKGQLADAKRSLDEQDAKLADFQRQYMGKLPTEEAPNMNMLASLNTQLDAATQALARMQQDKTYEEAMMTAAVAREQPATTADQLRAQPQAQELQLQALLKEETELTAKYTDSYPDVVAVRRKISELQAEMAKPAPAAPATTPAVAPNPKNEPMGIIQLRAQMHALDQMIAQKTRDQAQIQSQIRIYQDRVSSSPMVMEQYKNLTRDYQTAQQIYDNLLRNVNSSKMATDLEMRQQGRQFKVMDAPNLPEGPIYPRVELFVGAGLAAGLFLGLLVVGWIEYRDTAVRSERDLWAFTRLPTLAVISLSGNAQPEARRSWFKFGKDKEKYDAGGTNKPLMDAGA